MSNEATMRAVAAAEDAYAEYARKRQGQRVIGHGFGAEVLRALGIDPKGARTIDIRIRSNELVSVTVEHGVFDVGAKEFVTFLKKYELRERNSEQGA